MPEAVLASIEHNACHGLRLSNADKRASVRLALTHAPERSDAAIAALCSVSPRMVAKHRGRAGANGAELKRVGRDGKRYPRKPSLASQAASAEHGNGGVAIEGSSVSGDEERRLSNFADGIIKLRHIAHLLVERFPEFHSVVQHELLTLARLIPMNSPSTPSLPTAPNHTTP